MILVTTNENSKNVYHQDELVNTLNSTVLAIGTSGRCLVDPVVGIPLEGVREALEDIGLRPDEMEYDSERFQRKYVVATLTENMWSFETTTEAPARTPNEFEYIRVELHDCDDVIARMAFASHVRGDSSLLDDPMVADYLAQQQYRQYRCQYLS